MNSDIPTFIGFAHVGGKLTLDFPAQVTAWCKRLAADTGEEVELLITKRGQQKSRLQESGFHAMIAPWWKERGWESNALKQFILKKTFGTHDFVDIETDEVIQVLAEPHTSKLTRAQYSELIENSMVLAAHDDFYLVAPDEYRKAKAAAAKKAARDEAKQQQTAA